jgi:competence protein ComEA
MPRSSRLALWCLALLLCVPLLLKGRVPTQGGEGAAFFGADRSGTITVRLAGDFPRPGLCLLPDGTSPLSAIKMTLPGAPLPIPTPALAGGRLVSGDILTIKLRGRQPAVLSMGRMAVTERMLLGIALEPDLLGAEEWALLPGIGPTLAGRIVQDRHENGAFGTLEGVLRVPGVGRAKLAGVSRYF